MKTQIVYVLIASDDTLFLEEFWVSLYSLRHFHPEANVTVLVDAPTAELIKKRKQLYELITDLKIVPVPEEYNSRLRSRTIKTSVRNLIDGDYLYIDTDTVITEPLDEIDNLPIKNIAMVPELHGPFKKYITYNFTCNDVKRIFDVDVSDAPYWYNAGVTFVRDNTLTRDFFKKWHDNWEYSAFKKGQTSDMRALICTDKSYGYIIESLPDVYNSQVAMSIKYLYDAKIVHFWHMRKLFKHDENYSPFCNKSIYRQIKKDGCISETTSDTILNCKSSFSPFSMVVGREEMTFLLSSVYTVLGRSYHNSKSMRWFLDKLTRCVYLYGRAKAKLIKKEYPSIYE
jgi:hypothetical protein